MPGLRHPSSDEIRKVAEREQERIEREYEALHTPILARKAISLLRVLVWLMLVHMALQLIGLAQVFHVIPDGDTMERPAAVEERMDETRIKVGEITGPQAAELRARESVADWMRDGIAKAEADLEMRRKALAIAENERQAFAGTIIRSLGLPSGPAYAVSVDTGEVTAPMGADRAGAAEPAIEGGQVAARGEETT